MEHLTFYIVISSYLLLLVALTCFHVPSLASNVSIFSSTDEVTKFYSPGFQNIFRWPLWLRIVIFMLPLLVIYATFAWPLLSVFGVIPHNHYLFQPNPILSLFMVVLGLGIVFTSIAVIRKQNKQSGDSFKLHTESVFKFTRNPGLLGMYFYAMGLWCLMPAPTFLAGLVVYVLYMHIKVLMEEDFLTNKFGDDYRAYIKDTARYFSFSRSN